MSVGGVRIGETDNVPMHVGSRIWFLVLDVDREGKIVYAEYRSNKNDFPLLLAHLRSSNDRTKVFANWHGEWRTDLFDMDIPTLMKRVGTVVVSIVEEERIKTLERIKKKR
jgi:hypothetical protein